MKNKAIKNAIQTKNSPVFQITDIKIYHHILNKDETGFLFQSLDQIFCRVKDLNLQNKKIRKKLGENNALNYTTNQIDLSKMMETMNSPKKFLSITNNHVSSTEEMLEKPPAAKDIEDSYLLTELDSVTSRTISPNTSALNTSTNFKQSKRKALKSQAMKEKES